MATADPEETVTWYLLKEDKEEIFPGAPSKNKIIPRGTIVFSTDKEKKASSKATVSVCLKDKPNESLVLPRNKLEKINKSQVGLLLDTPNHQRFDPLPEESLIETKNEEGQNQEKANRPKSRRSLAISCKESDEEEYPPKLNIRSGEKEALLQNTEASNQKVIDYKQTIRKNWRSVIVSSSAKKLKKLVMKTKLLRDEQLKTIDNLKSRNTEIDQMRLLLGSLLKSDAHELVVDVKIDKAIQAVSEEHGAASMSDQKDIIEMEEFLTIKRNWDICKQQLQTYRLEILQAISVSQIVDMLFEQNALSCNDMMACVSQTSETMKLDRVFCLMNDMDDDKLRICLQCVKHCSPGVYSLVTNAGPSKKEVPVSKVRQSVATDLFENPSPLKRKIGRINHNDPDVKKQKPYWDISSKPSASTEKLAPKPTAVEPPDSCNFVIGSMVELRLKSMKEPQPGVIRWMGTKTKNGKIYAGLEMENALPGGVALTTLDGHIPFKSIPGKRAFAPLDKCYRDSRFAVEENINEVIFEETERIEGDTPPIKSFEEILGLEKGIQGHYNSCYLDATVFAMFAFNDSLDSLLGVASMASGLTQLQEDIRCHMKEKIVNPLRVKHQVRADNITTFRKLLDKLNTVQGLLVNEKDPEEFLTAFVQHTLHQPAFMELSQGDGCYIYTITGEKDEHVIPTVQRLLNVSFQESDIRLKQVPQNVIVQIPRSGKHFKMYDMVFPSPTIYINDIVEQVRKECIVCNTVATMECRQCAGDLITKSGRVHGYFCNTCMKQRHNQHPRTNHKPEKLNADKKKSNRSSGTKSEMELYATLCIETSHYVCFAKTGKGRDQPWVLFDSMADRTASGQNIPEITRQDDISEWLSDDGYKKLINKQEKLPQSVKRYFSDVYLCFYRSSN